MNATSGNLLHSAIDGDTAALNPFASTAPDVAIPATVHVPVHPWSATAGATTQSNTFVYEALPTAVFAAPGDQVALSTILTQNFGANFGGYTNYYITYYGAASLQSFDFSYWNPSLPSLSKWFYNGTDIGPDFNHQHYVNLTNVPLVTFQAGNTIGPVTYVAMQIGTNEYVEYQITTIDPSLKHIPANNAEPTAADVVAEAQLFAAKYQGVPNDNDCHFIAGAIAAAVGATLIDATQSLDPSQNVEGGFWRIAYRGSDANPVTDWHTLVKPGDIVRMGWTGGGQHTTLVMSVNSNGSLHVFDNVGTNNSGVEIMNTHDAFYDQQTIPTTITIYRLTTDGLYLTNGTANSETLSGTLYADKIAAGDGDDIVTGWIGNDVLQGGTGNDHLDGGKGADKLTGGSGADTLTGGAGNDKFIYTAIAQSNAAHYDTITDFDADSDKFNFSFKVKAIDTKVTAALHAATLDADIDKVVTKSHLGAHDAVLVVGKSGDLSGHTFLVVDANGVAGYQSGKDFVIDITGATHLTHLAAGNFI